MTDSTQSARPVPSVEQIQDAFSQVKTLDDFFGKDGVVAKLVGPTMQHMMEAELTAHLGYDKYAVKGRNSGNSRNGGYERKVKTSVGELAVEVPRDRDGSFSSTVLRKYATASNELEDKIIMMYAKGMTVRDIQDSVQEMYGVETSPTAISMITEKIWPLVIEWQQRPLESIYTFVFLDAIHIKMRRDGKIQNTAVYICLGIGVNGTKDVLGHWIGDGGEGANFWLSVITELKNRGVQDIFIACVDGLTGFSEAIHAVFSKTHVQRCLVHQMRNSLKYVAWKDKKDFATDMKRITHAPTQEAGETALLQLSEKWGKKYAIAVKSWENNWHELTTFYQFTPEIRTIMYTTNGIEAYNRQLRKATKTKSVFPTTDSVQKMLYLAYREIHKKWGKTISNWPSMLNQLAIRFDGRM